MSENKSDIVLDMINIHKSFGKLEVLQGIDLQVKRAFCPEDFKRKCLQCATF